MAGEGDAVGQARGDLGHGAQQDLGPFVGLGRARIEHRAAFLVDQLDAQTLRRLVDQDLLGELGQLRHVLHGLFQRFRGALQGGLFAGLQLGPQRLLAGGVEIG